jgi:hypothetical protein
MTSEQLTEKQRKQNILFETARKIVDLLEAAETEYGTEWSDDDAQTSIIELVTEDA